MEILITQVLGSSDIRLNKKDSKLNLFAFPPSEKYQLSCITNRSALLRKFAFQEEDYISSLWIVLEVHTHFLDLISVYCNFY
jgi:hypothetical protein